MRKEYKYKYAITTVTATLDDFSLTLKRGFHTWTLELNKIRYLYVIEHEGIGKELFLTYESNADKLKTLRTLADFGELEFLAFIDALVKLKPTIDIRQKPKHEALKMMKTANTLQLMIPVILLAICCALSVFFWPNLIHGFFTTVQTLSIDQLSRKEIIKSTHLLITDPLLLFDYSLKETSTDEESGIESISYYIPVVSQDWTDQEPVRLVLQTKELSDDEFAGLYNQEAVPGVLRNVLWEGLSDDKKKFFTNDLGINLAPDVLLMEYDADTSGELYLSLIIIGVGAIVLLVFFIIWGRAQRQKK